METSKNKKEDSLEILQCNIFASLTAVSPQHPALSCLSPERFCRTSNLHLLSFHHDCSFCSLAHTPPATPCHPPFVLSVSWLAGQAWSAYNSLIGALISSISARGSSWLQMKWIWFGLWLRAKHLLRPEEVIEEEVQARWNQRDWRPANRTARPSVPLVCGGERKPDGGRSYSQHVGSGRDMEFQYKALTIVDWYNYFWCRNQEQCFHPWYSFSYWPVFPR